MQPFDETGMMEVLAAVAEERRRQEALYPEVNDTLIDGTGPDVRWLEPYTEEGAAMIESRLRWNYESYELENGLPTWMHLVREEVAEVFKETDPARLGEELIQVAALCVSWVERLQSR